jgi:hypothetical protein
MVKKEINGSVFYCWDDNEDGAREKFEIALAMNDALGPIMESLLEAVARARINAQKNLDFTKDKIKADVGENVDDATLTYHWIVGGFKKKA